jgi:hypothetical protein
MVGLGCNKRDPNAWLAQCNEAVIIMDGHNGRDMKKPGRPLTKLARAEQAKLRGFPIKLIVLQRYGVENYFTQSAVETALSKDLSRYFPIPDHVPIQEHFAIEKKTWRWIFRKRVATALNLGAPAIPSLFSKSRNREIAQHLYPEHLKGTDLLEALENVVAIARVLRGEP